MSIDKEELYSAGISVVGFVGLVGGAGYGASKAASIVMYNYCEKETAAQIKRYETMEQAGATTDAVDVTTSYGGITRSEMKLIPIKELKDDQIAKMEFAHAKGFYENTTALPLAIGALAGVLAVRSMFGTRLGEFLDDFADNAGDFVGMAQDGAVRRLKKGVSNLFIKKDKALPDPKPGE